MKKDELKLKKGLSTNLAEVANESGSILFETDTGNLYIDHNGNRKQITDTSKPGLITKKNNSTDGSSNIGEIFNDYTNNTASGNYSHAEGSNTQAKGEYSHAEGIRTCAYGSQSHSEGFGSITQQNGTLNIITSKIIGETQYKHTQITIKVAKSTCITKMVADSNGIEAETVVGFKIGDAVFDKHTVFLYNNIICNVFDFIPQDNIIADPQNILVMIADVVTIPTGNTNITFVEQGSIGGTSHAEGGKTIAAGRASHTEGFGSKVLYKTENGDPIGAHAEGTNTLSMGKGSHSEGGNTQAEGKYSHSEGYSTIASGPNSHAGGENTIASQKCSHAEGSYTVASEKSCHAEGSHTVASGDSSHAEGSYTEASGWSSHAEGDVTVASGGGSHAEGYCTVASGDYSHAGGDHTIASRRNQVAIGTYNAEDSHALFMVGNGEEAGPDSYARRKNAFTVNKNGTATVQTDPQKPMDIVTKQYLENNIKPLIVTANLTSSIGGTINHTFSEIYNYKINGGDIDFQLQGPGTIVKLPYILGINDETISFGTTSVDSQNSQISNTICTITSDSPNDFNISQEVLKVATKNDIALLEKNKANTSDIPDIPQKLPNPNALTFTGAVSATYDGTSPVSIIIPNRSESGGGGSSGGSDGGKWEFISQIVTTKETSRLFFAGNSNDPTQFPTPQNFDYKKFYFTCNFNSTHPAYSMRFTWMGAKSIDLSIYSYANHNAATHKCQAYFVMSPEGYWQICGTTEEGPIFRQSNIPYESAQYRLLVGIAGTGKFKAGADFKLWGYK